MNRHQRRVQSSAPPTNADLLALRDHCREQKQIVDLALLPFDQPLAPEYVTVDGAEVARVLREARYWFGLAADTAERAAALSGEPRRVALNMLNKALDAAQGFRARAARLTVVLDQFASGVAGHA